MSTTERSGFLITARNSDNSKFYVRPKSAYLREKELGEGAFVGGGSSEGMVAESSIIEMIEDGKEFFTVNDDDEFTVVIAVDGHIRTIANDTEVDNIGSLSVIG
jgi:hypothetical protein